MTEDEMVGWHRRLGGHEFEQALGDGEGQGSLACCSPRGRKESYMTEQLNNRIHRLKNKQCVCACVCACTHTCKILKKKKISDSSHWETVLKISLCFLVQNGIAQPKSHV